MLALKLTGGVYIWHNLKNHKCYVGSSINLPKRLYDYFSVSG
jgi:excinuclease UvrABC nuclease subunit